MICLPNLLDIIPRTYVCTCNDTCVVSGNHELLLDHHYEYIAIWNLPKLFECKV